MSIYHKTNKPRTLCFSCANFVSSECHWADHYEPVPGWTARATSIHIGAGEHTRETSSFHVKECPLFQADKPRHVERIHDDGLKPLLYAMLLSMVRDYAHAYVKYNRDPNADNAPRYQMVMGEIERFVQKPMFEDIVDVLNLSVDGVKLLEIIKSDPIAVIERLRKGDSDNSESNTDFHDKND